MKLAKQKTTDKNHIYVIIGFLVLLGAIGYVGYLYYTLTVEFNQLTTQYERSQEENKALRSNLSRTEDDNFALLSALQAEEERNDAFAGQIEEITGVVGTLDKLSKTDPELLQKYSRVFFLNEHYMPSELSLINTEYLIEGDEEEWIHAKVKPQLERMVRDALADGVELQIVSAFRSFDTQADVKTGHLVTYGQGANQFSADQGFSEHQLGTTVDFSTNGSKDLTIAFANTDEYKWLTQNAHRFGFTLSYPQNNTYYQFEPWHWRFVGTALAADLRESNKFFYDLDQRELDTYLVKLFD